jgi:hypothetical protein
MPRTSRTLAEDFTRRLRRMEATRCSIEALANGEKLSGQAARQMYESLFVSACTGFEVFLEDLFIGLLVRPGGLRAPRVHACPRTPIRSYRVARDLVTGAGKDYIDWLPITKTIKRAALFFRGGRPFSSLTDADRSQLQTCIFVRHAIAHRSRFALAQFERRVISTASLPPRERSPAGYLRGLATSSPARTRYEALVGTMARCARKLAG